MNKDMHQIYETYKGTSATQEIIQEGLFDRLKARGAQAVGTVKGLGNQAAGIAKGAVAGVKGDTAGVQAAQQQRRAGAIQGDLAKIESYRATAMKKLDDTSQEIFNDMKGLGIDLNNISPANINAFKGLLNKSFDALTAGIKNPAAQNPAAQNPAAQNPAAQNPVTQPKSNVASSTGTTALPKK